MKITIITVGKQTNRMLQALIDDYELRLQKHGIKPNWVIIGNSDINLESSQILRHCNGTTVLLDETGTQLSSTQFAERLEQYQNRSVKELTFIIGGAFGVDDSVKQRADFVWSLSQLVFPHQIVRLLLVEQLYRAYDIMSGGKYHHS